MNISGDQVDFSRDELDRATLDPSPFVQFEKWYRAAGEAGIEAPNAMSLATASSAGVPTVRTVLLKMFDDEGLVFFTNYGSQKAIQLQENPRACAVFPWITMGRQVIVQGEVARIPAKESLSYFLSRPRESQLAAWASAQSEAVSTRALLDQAFQQIKARFRKGTIPLPDFWGGYRITPTIIEFWQSRKNRLHDRLEYRRAPADGWHISRLNP